MINCILCNKICLASCILPKMPSMCKCYDCDIFYSIKWKSWFVAFKSCKYNQNELDRIQKLKAFI